MSDEIRTPRGRVLASRPDTGQGYKNWGRNPLYVIRTVERFGAYFATTDVAWFKTLPEALDWLDARADETVAALLPPGSMVVTEDRVVELASILVKRVAGDHVSGLARVGAVNALIADLRAGAKS